MATQTKPQAMNAVEILKSDHRKVEELFKQFFESGERALKTREKVATQVFTELEIHSALEEQIFYPAYEKAAKEQGEEIVAEGLEEHHVVDLIIAELRQLTPEAENFEPKMKVLCENVQHHIQEEEEEMLSKAPRVMGDQLESLGERMLELKKQLMSAR